MGIHCWRANLPTEILFKPQPFDYPGGETASISALRSPHQENGTVPYAWLQLVDGGRKACSCR